MRRNLSVLLGLALSVGLLPALAGAATPFGNLNGLPNGQNAAGGVVGITGWALDDDGIERVEYLVDGVFGGLADYGQNNPVVDQLFPGYPDGAQNGFGFFLDTTRYSNDLHTVTARVTSNSGEQVVLNPWVVQINNTTWNLAPFGAITHPNASAELYGTCDLDDTTPRLSAVEGYALDVGIETGDTGVKYVELLINGGLYANTTTDCFYDDYWGGLTNCYGLPSLWLEEIFPTVANAPHGKFRFVLDVGFLISGVGFSQGFHELTIRAGDYAGAVANIAEIPVAFFCDENLPNAGSLGFIDDPLGGELTAGLTTVSGWALDAQGVGAVEVYLDGIFVGYATYGTPRPDVTSLYPGFPDSAAPGWVYILDTTATSDGVHHLQVRVIDDFGAATILGERYFSIDNEVTP